MSCSANDPQVVHPKVNIISVHAVGTSLNLKQQRTVRLSRKSLHPKLNHPVESKRLGRGIYPDSVVSVPRSKNS